jgi:nonsense-mediated mRNA decay protein 3
MCEDCYLKSHPVAEVKRFKATKCKYCGALFVRGRWVKGREEELLARLLRDNLTVKGEIRGLSVAVEGDKVRYVVRGAGSPHEAIAPRDFVFEYEAPIVYDVCLDCRRNILGVERGVVHIRGFPTQLRDLDIKKVEALLEHTAFEVRGKNLGSILSVEKEDNGFAIMVTDHRLARHIAHKIHEALPSDFLESYKVVKARGDRKIYHYVATVYVLTVDQGDVIRRGDSLFLVLDIGLREVLAVRLSDNARVRIPAYRFTEAKTDIVGRGVLGEVVNGVFLDKDGRELARVGANYAGLAYLVEAEDRKYVVPLA